MTSHKTAIVRTKPSFLAKKALFFSSKFKIESILDWGCGRGDDFRFFQKHGFIADGYDPYWYPLREVNEGDSLKKDRYDLITCSYVLNVIKTPQQRIGCIIDAKRYLKRKKYFLACARSQRQIDHYAQLGPWKRLGDGYVTGSGTFQAGLSVPRLRHLLETAGLQVLTTGGDSKTVWALGKKK